VARRARGEPNPVASWWMPKLWIYLQAAIIVFVVAGMVIAIVRLA
jgi:hypothetical protein